MPLLHLGVRVRRRRAVGGQQRHLQRPPPTPPGDRRVDHHPAYVDLGRVPAQYPPPAPMGLLQRRLRQVLGCPPVAGQQVGRPEQRPPLPLYEQPELFVVLVPTHATSRSHPPRVHVRMQSETRSAASGVEWETVRRDGFGSAGGYPRRLHERHRTQVMSTNPVNIHEQRTSEAPPTAQASGDRLRSRRVRQLELIEAFGVTGRRYGIPDASNAVVRNTRSSATYRAFWWIIGAWSDRLHRWRTSRCARYYRVTT